MKTQYHISISQALSTAWNMIREGEDPIMVLLATFDARREFNGIFEEGIRLGYDPEEIKDILIR